MAMPYSIVNHFLKLIYYTTINKASRNFGAISLMVLPKVMTTIFEVLGPVNLRVLLMHRFLIK